SALIRCRRFLVARHWWHRRGCVGVIARRRHQGVAVLCERGLARCLGLGLLFFLARGHNQRGGDGEYEDLTVHIGPFGNETQNDPRFLQDATRRRNGRLLVRARL